MPILSPERNKSGNQPLQKGPFFIFLMLLPAFVVIFVMILLAMQYKQLRAFVAPQPVELPKIETSLEAQEQVRTRLRDFLITTPASATASGIAAAAPAPSTTPATAPASAPTSLKPADSARARVTPALPAVTQSHDTLALTAADLNQLIRSSESLEKLQLDYHLDLQDTVLVARNSLPVEKLIGPLATMAKLMRIKGYLNSEMKGYPSFEDGKVIVVPVAAVMNGLPAPVSVLNAKGKLDLREWVGDKEFYDRAIAGLGQVRIRGGRLLLIRR